MNQKETLQKMMAAADQLNSANDNLLMAIAMIAATGNITVIPNDIGWSKPVIHLPKQMYDRLLKIIPNISEASNAE